MHRRVPESPRQLFPPGRAGTGLLLVGVLAFAGFAVRLCSPQAARAQQPAATGAASKALTVERIYGQPSLSGQLTTGLQWSPDGKRLSYFQREGTGREARTNIWALEVASGKRELLVDADQLSHLLPPAAEQPPQQAQQTGLGRFAPQRYFWAPRSDALLFVSQGNLYWFDLKAQNGKRLTTGREAVQDPKISQDGRWVSFVRGYNLWVVEVASGKEKQVTEGGREEVMNAQLDWVYPEELGIRTAYWWSPDSSQIAFLEMDERPVTRYPLVNLLSYTGETQTMRYPKAGDANPIVRVGVVPVAGGRPRWMDTGTVTDIYIPRVGWLRDSKRLAIQRLNRAQTKLELLVADARTGRAQVILTEEDPAWVNVHDDPYFFTDGQRFLWTSERDGFAHLYLYDLSGKLLKQVTRGAWEVASVAGVDERNGAVYFVSTEKSPIERHLYRTALEGGPSASLGASTATRLTREDGTHGILMPPDAAHYVDTYSSAMTPSRQDLYRSDATRVLTINENKVAELAEYALSPVEFFTLRGSTSLTTGAADGGNLHAFMIKPPDFDKSRKYPVLVYIYGGPGAQIVRNAWGGSRGLWHQMMAQKGYIIFGLDNRGMAGRGHAFEAPIHRKMGTAELADQLAGVEYLKSLAYVDGARIGIWGWSYGGYMTCYTMLNAAGIFKTGFAGAPVTDWRQYDTIYTERYMARPQENAEGYKQSSPVTHAAKLQGKLLIAHGTGDDNVHFANSIGLLEEFIRAGRHVEVQLYPGRGHGISDARASIHLWNRVTQFFVDNL